MTLKIKRDIADEPRDEDGRWTSGGGDGASSDLTQDKPTPSQKSMLAKQSAKYVGSEIQRYSEEHNEPILAKGISGLSLRDNEPVDVIVISSGVVEHGVELKTMVDNKANKITMKTSAMQRKADWVQEHKAPYHTVVFDDHAVFNANGPSQHDDSKRVLLYRRGFGSFRTDNMYKVADMAELKSLMAMSDDDLPAAAKPPKSYVQPPSKS
jgi:hypothetical protein